MAYEIKNWKAEDCTINLNILKLSKREISSSEIQKEFSEGGALNANYRTVEAVAIAANILGVAGMKYGDHFIFKTAGVDDIILDFRDKDTKIRGERIIKEYFCPPGCGNYCS